jgi:hypothetical protein
MGLPAAAGFGTGPGGRAGFIGMPKSSDASAIFGSSASVLLRLNIDSTSDRYGGKKG